MTTKLTRTGRTGTPRRSRTALAIRAALVASFVLATPAAFAGTCVENSPGVVTCSGTFTDDVYNSVPPADQIPNLVLTLDDTTVVTPAAGVNGLTAQWGGNVDVTSYADITTSGADGIHQYGTTSATLATYGDITSEVTAAGNNALDVSAVGGVSATVGGNVYAYDASAAFDVTTASFASTTAGVDLYVDGTGDISAYAYDGNAIAVMVDAFTDAYTHNAGTISAVSAYGNAAGLITTGNDSAYVLNEGSISADAYGQAEGVVAGSKYSTARLNNLGDISATAYDGTAVGAVVYGDGVTYLGNGGTIDASSTYGYALGAVAYGATGDVYFYNGDTGVISATGYGQAVGAGTVALLGNTYSGNYGSISADATGDLAADAFGVYQRGSGIVSFYNTGDVSASADTAGVGGIANATGVYQTGANLYFDNYGGNISAYASGDVATAIGVDMASTTALDFYNSGSISASAYGADSTAIGVRLDGNAGTTTFDNEGTISAYSDGTAIALQLNGTGPLNLTNNGVLAAYGDAYSIVIDTTASAGDDSVYNYGTITGNFYFGAGNDYFYNAEGATWYATGYTDFGDGDDTLVNNGDIFMTNAFIQMGAYTAAGNLFQNNSNIFLEGNNYVDVGGGPSLFVNDGTLDFQDGAADDTLTVYGNFAGTGNINVDVEGNAGVSDMLYIEGNVAANTDQTINVDMIDFSAPLADVIPIVEVSGTSTAGNFSLGDVSGFNPNDSFVNLDFSLIADIDTTNATPDVFSLGIAVTGLTDTGTIAAAIAPSVQDLMATEVGTWRQRMGYIDSFSDGGFSLWARVFGSKTDFSPTFESDDIGLNGNFDWKQKNRGVEGGLDFAVTDEFSLGLLVAKSKADIDLDPGNADAKIDANTWGLYGTWLSPEGFYLDASYRWTKFDTDINSVAGAMSTSGGKAETFNIEMGYAFGMAGGLKIEPQFQWTKTKVKDLDVLTTANGMTFTSDGADSSRARLGVAAYKTMGSGDGDWAVTPYVALSAVREFDGENNFAINDSLFGRTVRDGTSGLLEVAVTGRHGPLSVWAGLNYMDGGSVDRSFGGQLGVRYTFGGAAPAPVPPPVVAPPPKTCADLDDDADGVNNCDDKCPGTTAGTAVGADGCPVPAPQPEPEPAPKPYRG